MVADPLSHYGLPALTPRATVDPIDNELMHFNALTRLSYSSPTVGFS